MKRITFLFLFISLISYGQIDSTYYYSSEKILKLYPKSRINPSHLYDNAKLIYEKYDIVVPYKLAIAQALLETGLGSTGVGKSKNNPFSINSSKGYVYYNNIEDGIRAYYFLIAKRYLRCKNLDELLRNFTNCNNLRYAETKQYEAGLIKQIKRWDKY